MPKQNGNKILVTISEAIKKFQPGDKKLGKTKKL